MNVCAIIVTRGDVDLSPILTHLAATTGWPVVIWNNGAKRVEMRNGGVEDTIGTVFYYDNIEDLSVYGRYAAIEYASGDLIYVQDDDVIVSDPMAIVESWRHEGRIYQYDPEPYIFNHVVCNMPEAHRSQPFYKEHSLVGFGAVFHRDAPFRAFHRFGVFPQQPEVNPYKGEMFLRRADVVFTALTPRVLVDVPIRNLPYYDAPNRSWKQPEHFRERKEMLRLALEVRDNG